MEVRQSAADVQIYDTCDLRKEPLFFRGIHFEDGEVKVEQSNPKSKIRKVQLAPANMSGMKKMSVEEFKKRFNKVTVYQNIYEYAQRRFEKEVCEEREPKVRLLENNEVLRFEVLDLCREVLTDEANPLLCRLLSNLGYDCNWVKRELLTFIVVHEETGDGFQLSIEIDGKYGSGLYEHVRRGGYLSMEIDFDDYLERYADTFKEDLKQVILYGKDPSKD